MKGSLFCDPYTGELVELVARNPFSYPAALVSEASGLHCLDVSKTVQSATEEADINTIVRRFNLTGQLPTDLRAPVYGDFTGIGDFKSALNAVLQAEEAFMKMPAEVRSRFDNDAGLFVDFCSNPANVDEAVKLGLVIPEPVKAPPFDVRVVADPPLPVSS